MAVSDEQSPTPTELAAAARAASKLRDAVRRSGLLEVWPTVALDECRALVTLGQLTADATVQLAEFLEGVARPDGAPAAGAVL